MKERMRAGVGLYGKIDVSVWKCLHQVFVFLLDDIKVDEYIGRRKILAYLPEPLPSFVGDKIVAIYHFDCQMINVFSMFV